MKFLAVIATLFLVTISGIVSAQSGKMLTPDQFETFMNERGEVQLLDVRTPEEFSKGRIRGATNYNINGKEFTTQVKSLDKSKPVLVYCLSGSRSQKAVAFLKKQGFSDVYELKGGMMAWNKTRKPVARSGGSGMSTDDFEREINKESKLVLVDFHAKWCGPCKKMAPDLEALKAEYKEELVLLKIDADANPLIVDRMDIQAIPTLQIYKNGVKVWTHTGYLPKKDIEKKIQEQL